MDSCRTSDRKDLAVSATWVAVVQLALFVFVPAVWDDTDDWRMANIAAGIGSADGPSEFLVYINVSLGKLLSALYHVAPRVPWYTVMHVACLGVSFTAVTFATLQCRFEKLAIATLAIVQISLMAYFWTHLQFTTSAAMLAIGGIALLHIGLIRNRNENRFALLLSSGLLLTLSSLLRLRSLQLVLLITALGVIIALVRHRDRFHPRDLVLAGITVGLVWGMASWHTAVNNRDSPSQKFYGDLQTYAPFVNSIHVRLEALEAQKRLDKKRRMVAKELADAGLEWNDVSCAVKWFMIDETHFSTDALKTLHNSLFAHVARSRNYSLWLALLAKKLITNNIFLLMLGISIGVLTLSDRVQWSGTFGAATWLLSLFVMAGLLITLKLPARVVVPTAIASTMSSIMLVFRRQHSPVEPNQPEVTLGKKMKNVWFLVMSIAALLVTHEQVTFARDILPKRRITEDAISQLRQREDSLQVLLVPFPFMFLDPLKSQHDLNDWKFVYLDGHQRGPRQKKIVKNAIGQPLSQAFVGHPDIRVVVYSNADILPLIKRFYLKHYKLEVTFPIEQKLPWGTVRRVDASPTTSPAHVPAVDASGNGS